MATAARELPDLGAGEVGGRTVEFESREPQEVVRWALESFAPERVALVTSFQVDGMAIFDMAWRIKPGLRVFTVDTGRLPQETYDLLDRVRERYGVEVEVYCPDPQQVEPLLRRHGANLFYGSASLRALCCEVRKVEPLRRALRGLDCWITGLRRDQSATRASVRQVERDRAHGGLVKVNPLAGWTEEAVWEYVRTHGVPCHRLYDLGYKSIGCLPCTRAVGPGEDARAGRWWWERDMPKECGMHCAR